VPPITGSEPRWFVSFVRFCKTNMRYWQSQAGSLNRWDWVMSLCLYQASLVGTESCVCCRFRSIVGSGKRWKHLRKSSDKVSQFFL